MRLEVEICRLEGGRKVSAQGFVDHSGFWSLFKDRLENYCRTWIFKKITLAVDGEPIVVAQRKFRRHHLGGYCSSSRQEIVFFGPLINYLFTYLAAPVLSWGIRNLQSSLQHVWSLVAASELLLVACRVKFPGQGLNPSPLPWNLSHWTTREVSEIAVWFFFWDSSSDQRSAPLPPLNSCKSFWQ